MVPLPPDFYMQETTIVARQLLGKTLVHATEQGDLTGTIVETEAYLVDDPACHAYKGITPRNKVMFGPPGHAYVYLSYGIHEMLNIVTNADGVPEAVLVRAVAPVDGIPLMRHLRKVSDREPTIRLAAGPGRLAQAFGTNRALHNGMDLTDPASPLFVADGPSIPDDQVVTTTRIGITQGAEQLWRYYVRDSRAVSRR